MSLPEMRSRLTARIWQAIARSDVDVSSLPQEEMDKLVRTITEGILTEIDDILGQATSKPVSKLVADIDGDDEEERVLWEGRPFLSLSVYYQVTSERVRITEGLLGKERSDIELVRIQDVDHKQNLTERALNIGDVYIRSHDRSQPEVTLSNVSNPVEVHEILRRAILKARKKYNLTYREEM